VISYHEAVELILDSIPQPRTTERAIEDATGFALAEEIVSDIDVVAYRNSAMDGFAIRAEWLQDCSDATPVTLPIQQTVFAGDSPTTEAEDHSAAKIMTGAPVPDGYDTVVKFEDISYDSSTVTFRKPVTTGANIRLPGEDIKRGELLWSIGERLTQLDIGILASIGRSSVKVYAKPSLLVATTGNELIMPGEVLHPGKLYNSNLYTVSSMVGAFCSRVDTAAAVIDEPDTLKQVLRSHQDVIVTSGGVSVGEKDLVVPMAEATGWTVLFHKARIKPGKPFLLARRNDQLLFGLPGNPLSTAVTCAIFVVPALKKMSGLSDYRLKLHPATLAPGEKFRAKRTLIWPGEIRLDRGERIVRFVSKRSSAALTALRGSDGLIFQHLSDDGSIGTIECVEWSAILG